jgi:molybdopterin molybdotransferase
MKKMLNVDDARALILERMPRMGTETVALDAAAGRVAGAELRSRRDLPGFDNSAMDGYAVRAADIESAPVTLPLVSQQIAGGARVPALEAGQAARIMTGAPVPEGADTVVMREMTDESNVGDDEPPAGSGEVVFERAVELAANIRRRGEDVAEGDVVVAPGQVIKPEALNLIAASGHASVVVSRRPKVAVIASGDEIVEVGSPAGPDDVINSNAHAIAAAARMMGAEAHIIGIAKDTLEDHVRLLEAASFADVVLTIGGVSVGTHDFVKPAMEQAGFPLELWKVAMRPGKPLAFSTQGARAAFGVPGNPVSSLVSFRLFVAPALRRMMGVEDVVERPMPARFEGEPYEKRKDLRYFARADARVDDHGVVVALGGKQSSGQISGMATANALCVINEGIEEVRAGDQVGVLWL